MNTTGGTDVGKSALAVHVAHRLAVSFQGGQLFVELGDAGARARR